MAKTEINNEIVLLRHAVRQAQFCVVNKAVREAKLLRNKHGTEVQQEKYKRKADRLIAEVHALKPIKADDISKFGITNEREMNDILQDQSSSNSDRIMAKVVHHKSLYSKLMQFREKFPDYEKYLIEGKKTTKLKDKITTKSKKSSKKSSTHILDKNLKKEKVNSDENSEHSQCNSKDEKVSRTELSETRSNSHKRKKPVNEDNIISDTKQLTKLEEDSVLEDISVNKQSSMIKPCGVTKEATVKRFAELLEEEEFIKDTRLPAKNTDSVHGTVQAKPNDDFFITGDERDDYQENHINVLTLHAESHKRDMRTKTFQSSNQIKMRDARCKNDASFSKSQKYNQLRGKSEEKNRNKDKRHLDKQYSIVKQEKRLPNKIGKNTHESANINNKEESAGLHPSWLARKKQQEIMNQGFQGKRIVFD